MKRHYRKIILLSITLLLVLTVSGCNTQHFDEPIGTGGGWGWFQAIVEWLDGVLIFLSELAGGHYIVGLIVLTLIIRTAGWPIYSKSTAMSTNMQMAQPELDKIKEKYAGKKDETSQKMFQQEQMQIFKKYKINPLGCLFPFLQMPIFIAMYQVVRRFPRGAGEFERYEDINFQFLFMDFAAPSPLSEAVTFDPSIHWINVLLAAIVGLTMYISQKYTMNRPDYLKVKDYKKTPQQQQQEKTMKFMMYFMVVMLTSVAFTSLGIAVYWIIGNLFQILQTNVNRKQMYKRLQEHNVSK